MLHFLNGLREGVDVCLELRSIVRLEFGAIQEVVRLRMDSFSIDIQPYNKKHSQQP